MCSAWLSQSVFSICSISASMFISSYAWVGS